MDVKDLFQDEGEEARLQKALEKHMKPGSGVPEAEAYLEANGAAKRSAALLAKVRSAASSLSHDDVERKGNLYGKLSAIAKEHPVEAFVKDRLPAFAENHWVGSSRIAFAKGEMRDSVGRFFRAGKNAANIIKGDLGLKAAPHWTGKKGQLESSVGGLVDAAQAKRSEADLLFPEAAEAFGKANPEIAAWEKFLISNPSAAEISGLFGAMRPGNPARVLAAEEILRRTLNSSDEPAAYLDLVSSGAWAAVEDRAKRGAAANSILRLAGFAGFPVVRKESGIRFGIGILRNPDFAKTEYGAELAGLLAQAVAKGYGAFAHRGGDGRGEWQGAVKPHEYWGTAMSAEQELKIFNAYASRMGRDYRAPGSESVMPRLAISAKDDWARAEFVLSSWRSVERAWAEASSELPVPFVAAEVAKAAEFWAKEDSETYFPDDATLSKLPNGPLLDRVLEKMERLEAAARGKREEEAAKASLVAALARRAERKAAAETAGRNARRAQAVEALLAAPAARA